MKDEHNLSERHSPGPGLDGTASPVEERARIREQRARKTGLRRKKARLFWGTALVLLVAALVALGVVFSRPGGFGKKAGKPSAPKPASSQPAATSQPATTQPGEAEASSSGPAKSPQASVKVYSWAGFKVPGRRARRSVATAPTVAIVVDDVGNTREPLPKWTAIDAPINFAVMPYPPIATELAWALHQSGYEIMMHIPTQNTPPNSFSGKGQLSMGMDLGTVFAQLDADITGIPYVGGINNHQGGLGCDDLGLMTSMCQWASSKGLYIVDSNSSNNSKVTQATLALGQPRRKNQVFIDHQNDPNYIRSAMRELADLARKNGTAVGICHWHRPNTPTVVGEMVIELKKAGINFAFVKDITN